MEDGFPFLYVSDCFLNILGWTEEELKSRFDNKFTNLVHPEDRHLVNDYVNQISYEAEDNTY